MSIFACIDLTDEFTGIAESLAVQDAVRDVQRGRGEYAHELVRERLAPSSRELLDAEVHGMPMGVWNAIGEMVATAADHNVAFRFQSVAPDNVMDFARKRRMRFTFDVEEEAIVVTLQHTLRHPSWLPEVVLPEHAEAVAASA